MIVFAYRAPDWPAMKKKLILQNRKSRETLENYLSGINCGFWSEHSNKYTFPLYCELFLLAVIAYSISS